MDYSDKDKDFFIEKFYDDYYGAKWNWGKEVVTITYSFPSSSLRSGAQGLITNLTREFTTAEKEAITSAINLWDNELETIEFKYFIVLDLILFISLKKLEKVFLFSNLKFRMAK